ncbi:hypothetical protein B0J18DRAFT_492342 [Chaetomium sp. MPI-SDFR-AT-0129]|nr:hypothetical protein B0J18DRAFT_492342 [Chaetomium sp. MPI-SDFR-AT-0129]
MARPYSSVSSNSNYRSSSNYSSYNYSYAHHPTSPSSTSLLDDIHTLLFRALRALVRFWRERGQFIVRAAAARAVHRLRLNLSWARVVSFPHLLVALWVVVLVWGERWAFEWGVGGCRWEGWEDWPAGANPHRVALVADPQLIDPHSYPGRPWPLNPLTMLITDNYLRRSYGQLQRQLDPDSVFFLGDLFDGGREWKTAHGKFEDPAWGPHPKGEQRYLKQWHKSYGEVYWLKEYARFGDIFLNPWVKTVGAGQEGGNNNNGDGRDKRRKLVASLPGNHDLGFGDQIKVAVRDRFETYFGEGNRIDVIGNHTFVSVDTVSMSAASSTEAQRHDLREIYEPVQRFLGGLKTEKPKAVERELRYLRGEIPGGQQKHAIEDLETATFDGEGKNKDKQANENKPADLPTILLTHVPLYRPPGTPCGPLREKYPPATPPKGQTDPVVPDHRNAISVSAGYQYQNVLREPDSEALVAQVGNVVHAFSGDDHDYCAVTHSAAQASVPEITVKSISMAMGVMKPGFLLVSLYNPIDPATGESLSSSPNPNTEGPVAKPKTLQTHLCLLPSQLSTYLRYVTFALVSIAVLAIRAVLVPILGLTPFALDPTLLNTVPSVWAASAGRGGRRRSVLLPVFKAKVEDYEEYAVPSQARGYGYYGAGMQQFSSSSTSSTTNGNAGFGGGIGGGARDRSGSGSVPSAITHQKSPGGHQQHSRRKSHGKGSAAGKWGWAGAGGRARAAPRIEIASEGEEEDDDVVVRGEGGKWKARGKRRKAGGGGGGGSVVGVVVRELWTTVWRVAWMVVGYFAWLTWRG